MNIYNGFSETFYHNAQPLTAMTFDSIQAAAAALALDYDHLATARQQGCPCMRNSRVYSEGLFEWLKANTRNLNRNLDCDSRRLNARMLRKAEAALAKINGARQSRPGVDVLVGLEEKLVGLTAEQAAAIVAELKAKLKAA